MPRLSSAVIAVAILAACESPPNDLDSGEAKQVIMGDPSWVPFRIDSAANSTSRDTLWHVLDTVTTMAARGSSGIFGRYLHHYQTGAKGNPPNGEVDRKESEFELEKTETGWRVVPRP